MMIWLGVGAAVAWLYLLLAHGGFWRMREHDFADTPYRPLVHWPSVVAVVPARDEADVIGQALTSLFAQDYPGSFHIVLVDDGSTDSTAAAARTAARAYGAEAKLTLVLGAERPAGWTGKLWAMEQGIAQAAGDGMPDYFWFTDADIAHAPETLRTLARRAETGRLVLVSLIARLHCAHAAERLLIPAFVYFFALLFPFNWVNDPARRTAAAAGGCMLVRTNALCSVGGLTAIRGRIIDDCALARMLKPLGPIWLGLTARVVSLRRYRAIAEIRDMVARSAYAQLGFSPALLAATLLGMLVLFAAPILLVLVGPGSARLVGLAIWLIMSASFHPILRFYRVSPLWAFMLPAIGSLYASFTAHSALEFWRGKGGMWKGRIQAERAQ